jgi:diguanylate cyclase (GGDEF)-like protein
VSRALWGALALAGAIPVVLALLGVLDMPLGHALRLAVAYAATAATLAGALRRRGDHTAWLLLAAGLATTTAAATGLNLGGQRAFPSFLDVLFLAYAPLVIGAAVLMAQARVPRFGAAMWLDCAIGALGAAAIVTQLLMPLIHDRIGGGLAALVALAYPTGDVLLLMLVVAAIAAHGSRIGPTGVLVMAGIAARVVTDAFHVWVFPHGSRQPAWVVLMGLASLVTVAVAALRTPTPRRAVVLGGGRVLAVPGLLALVALGLLVLDHFHHTTDAPVWLSAATLVAVMVRMAMTFTENARLSVTRQLALTDELTGLANRRRFYERLNEAVAESSEPLAVAMVDLDRFKELNDTLGHHAGDMLLAQLGPRLEAVVGDAGMVARLGGDEFALLLPGAGLARAAEFGRRVGAALQEPFVIDGLEVVMDASVGAALAPQHGTKAEALLQRADVAMYQAKESRTGFQAYDPARDRHSRERLTLMAELRRALERDELILHYQPKVRLSDGTVVGVEALVRWQHPVHGLRGPGAFLPHAEHTALMRPLTLHVLETAMTDLARWRADGLDLHVAVNLAVQNLLDLRTPGHVGELLARHGLPPSALTLEVTESLLLHDPQRAGEVLRDLREMGVGLALDDFGTGYSSLEHLKRLPVDELKIDKSFVMAMDRDPADHAIVASTAGLGRALGLRVVAEGVESAASAALLVEIGCELAQGFHYSPPVPGEQLPGLVRTQIGVVDLVARRARDSALPGARV